MALEIPPCILKTLWYAQQQCTEQSGKKSALYNHADQPEDYEQTAIPPTRPTGMSYRKVIEGSGVKLLTYMRADAAAGERVVTDLIIKYGDERYASIYYQRNIIPSNVSGRNVPPSPAGPV